MKKMAISLVQRHIAKSFMNSKLISCITCRRTITITSYNMDKALENLENNPYYEKYSARIAELQKNCPEKFKNINKQHQIKAKEKSTNFGPVDTRQFSSVLNPKTSQGNESSGEEKKLSDIFKVDLVEDKDGAEIKIIWEEYHKLKEVISATIPLQLYSDIQGKMKQFPTFLFPLPRAQGYEFMLSQCHAHSVHFTPLLAYQIHKENSPECLTMVHYTELGSKGIVLMRGEYDKNVLTAQEAQCLANQFQMYYNGKEESKLKLLETFTKSPNNFNHMDLISNLENIQLI